MESFFSRNHRGEMKRAIFVENEADLIKAQQLGMKAPIFFQTPDAVLQINNSRDLKIAQGLQALARVDDELSNDLASLRALRAHHRDLARRAGANKALIKSLQRSFAVSEARKVNFKCYQLRRVLTESQAVRACGKFAKFTASDCRRIEKAERDVRSALETSEAALKAFPADVREELPNDAEISRIVGFACGISKTARAPRQKALR